ncbi:POK8 protein, partial [Piaya cayana]|nr:POK8 protein [Piaya cayana]
PWQYLGWRITTQTIQSQAVKLVTTVSSLNDLQNLLGSINWVQPLLGLTNEDLRPLF